MEQSVKHKAVPPLGRARVLIAEDDALIAIDLETVLAEAGAEVVGPCLTVEDALIAAAERELSAAMLDIQLRNETIEPVARLLARRNTPFVFYTGELETDPVRLMWPESKIIRKPAMPRTIVNTIAEVMENSSVFN
jgi:DNA-binding response OmpR family regulator